MSIELHKDEAVLLERRRHWFIIFSQILPLLLLIITPPILALIIPNLLAGAGDAEIVGAVNEFLREIPIVVWIALYAGWLQMLWTFTFIHWTNYYLDTLVLTTERIIDTEQVSLFHREQATVPLKNIQDVTVEVQGIIPSLLNFGDIHIQTAGAQREAVIYGLDKPAETKQAILEAHNKYMDR